MTGYVPSQDLDAEAAVLSTCLLVPEAYDEVVTVLQGAHFYSDANRYVFEAIESVIGRPAKPDLVSVASHLRSTGRLEDVGGTPYLAKLVNATPATAHVLDHARIVRDCWRRRTTVQILSERLSALKGSEKIGDDELDEWLASTAGQLDAVTKAQGIDTVRHASEGVKELAESVTEAREGRLTVGLPTGLSKLDTAIGGLRRGCKYELAARPGIGKTGFLCSIAAGMANAGHGVILLSLEMSRKELILRMVAQKAIINSRKIESGHMSPNEWESYIRSADYVARLPIMIDDAGTQTVTSMRASVRRCIKRLRDKHPETRLGLIGIDYVQIMKPEGGKRGQSREQEIAEISSATRALAKEFDCAVVELSQLSRECEKRPDKRPLLSDMKDSGAIEADAFGVLMLYREDKYRREGERKDGRAEILIRKLRGGGREGTVYAQFHEESAGFADELDQYDASGPMDDFR